MLPPLALAQSTPVAVKAWFTDAEIKDSTRVARPEDALPAVPGTAASGVLLVKAAAVENPLLQQQNGLISFWIRPNWDGDDGRTHHLLRIGDPQRNGLLVEKAATGMLRYVMASPAKITASRADVSHWRAGDWHHVVVGWMSRENKPLGLPLWIDKVAVAGPVAGGNEFLDPKGMEDQSVWIGHASSDAVMDELIFRDRFNTEGPGQMTAVVYRDHFRTAPYTRIEITPEALRVRSDRRVVNGHPKQFGLLAEFEGRLVPVTDYAVRYGQWSEFDAKPLIQWETSDEKIATVDKDGMVTGQAVGRCTLAAEFRGLRASYDLEVIPVEQPDLDVVFVARLPRLPTDRAKWWPEPGEEVESVAHIENFGFKAVPGGTVVRFELLPDANRNFLLDPEEVASATQERVLTELEPRQKREVRFKWKWIPNPVWVRVTLDPADKVSEICEANNQVCELNLARPLEFAYEPDRAEPCYSDRKVNHVGSFSYADWIRAQMQRFEVMIREQVYPTTTPHGIEDSFRCDRLYALQGGDWGEEPYVKEQRFYDGGFPVREPVNLMAVDAAILHEFGHTVLKLPDLYSHPVNADGVLLKDEEGEYYAGGELLPIIDRGNHVPFSSANGVPCGVGYNSLMNQCHLWMNPAHAGQAQHLRGFRGERFWGVQGRLIPAREHIIEVYDLHDAPLTGAAVYVYHVTQTQGGDHALKYFHDRAKFIGHTDEDGCFTFPHKTDKDWDDPDTDEIEHQFQVWNPFGRAFTLTGAHRDVAFTPNVWQVEGLLLLKIVSGEQTEFAWLLLTEFNEAYFRGDRVRGVFPIRTSLLPSPEATPLVRRPIPEAIRQKNLRPIAVVPDDVTVKVGEEFTIDASQSHDPEGQPLLFRWRVHTRGVEPPTSQEPVYRGTAPKKPKEFEIVFAVLDGLRACKPVRIKVHVVESDAGESPAAPEKPE